ncbi:hypothetical protein OAE59_01175 [Synechococcus sp. AH-551-B05]|nr:hypothetical protein [Synechococcus sp. AH-551-B05]MDB4677233.1 hypothetical protein [Synechococcus sp. AH-551-B05]
MTKNTDLSNKDKLYISNNNKQKDRKLFNGQTFKREHEIPDDINKSDLSDHSIEVMETFGIEAAALLNDYSCRVEDALIDAVRKIQDLKERLEDAEVVIAQHQLFKKQVLVSLNMTQPDKDKEINYED